MGPPVPRSPRSADPLNLPRKRIEHLKSRIRMRDVMEHFGHSYRLHGNMLCPWHSEKNPSARLYDKQDSFFCWVCSPSHGVDIVEFVMIELSLEQDQPTRGVAVLKALDYLEEAFNTSHKSTPWEDKLSSALHRGVRVEDPVRYWRQSHLLLLQTLAQYPSPDNWKAYSISLQRLLPHENSPISSQRSLWLEARSSLTRG